LTKHTPIYLYCTYSEHLLLL